MHNVKLRIIRESKINVRNFAYFIPRTKKHNGQRNQTNQQQENNIFRNFSFLKQINPQHIHAKTYKYNCSLFLICCENAAGHSQCINPCFYLLIIVMEINRQKCNHCCGKNPPVKNRCCHITGRIHFPKIIQKQKNPILSIARAAVLKPSRQLFLLPIVMTRYSTFSHRILPTYGY